MMRKYWVAFLCVLKIFGFFRTAAKQVDCENFQIYDFGTHYDGNQKACWMNGPTAIGSRGVTISSEIDEVVGGMRLEYNGKIKFLPSDMGEKFPNFIAIYVYFCSLSSLKKNDFKNLKKLIGLHLQKNLISRLTDDVFEELIALEYLYLDNNPIKFMNGEIFNSLTNLRLITFIEVECINAQFEGSEPISNMPQEITEKCGYCKNSPYDCEIWKQVQDSQTSINLILKGQNQQFEMQKKCVSEIQLENTKHLNEVSQYKITIARLEEKLKSASFQIALYEMLHAQANETCNAKSQNLLDLAETYQKEVESLSEQLQKKSVELSKKEEENIQLNRRIELRN